MRMVMVTTEFPRFSQTFIASKLVGLIDRGVDVHLVAETSDSTQWSLFPQLQSVPGLEDRVHIAADQVEPVLLGLEPDLVHFEFTFLANRWRRVKDSAGFKMLVSVRAYEPSIVQTELPDPYRELWSKADALHLLSHDLWLRVQERGCPADKRHVIIPPAINTGFFDAQQGRTYEPVGSVERPLRILSVGRLHWHKGYEYALHAVHLLARQGVHCEYRIIGDGDYKPALIYTSGDLKLGKVVKLLGVQPRSEVMANMLWADVFLHAAVSEGFGNSPIEAQAMGLPVVCTDAGGLGENVADNETGFVVPRRNPWALAEKLRVLADDVAQRERLGVAGRRRVETSFRIEDQVDRFDAFYRELLGAPARPAEPSPAIADASGNDGSGLSPRVRRREADLRAQLDDKLRDLEDSLQRHREETAKLEAKLAKLNQRTERESSRLTDEIRQLRQKIPLKVEMARFEYSQLLRDLVRTVVPPASNIAVVSRGDDELLVLNECNGWHFPQAADGCYAGYHPATSAEAIEHLEELSGRGAEFLLFPSTAFWWLEHYVEFHDYLSTRLHLIHRDEHAIIYGLQQTATPDRRNTKGSEDARVDEPLSPRGPPLREEVDA